MNQLNFLPKQKSAIIKVSLNCFLQHCNLPIVTLLGGKQGESVELYRAISQQPPKQMAQNVLKYRAEGYRKFQLKLGGKVEDDIQRIFECRKVLERSDVLVADANTGRFILRQALIIIICCIDAIQVGCNTRL